MHCVSCGKDKEKGDQYTFYYANQGDTEKEKTGFKEYTYTTHYFNIQSKSGYVCSSCYLKSLLLSDVGLILIGVPLFLVASQMGDTFLETLIYGILLAPLVLFLDILGFGTSYFFKKYGDRVLIRIHRKKLRKEGYIVVDRAKAVKLNFIEGNPL